MFPLMVYVSSKKDLTIFMKIGSIGVIFIMLVLISIVSVGIVAFTNTDFSIGTAAEEAATNWDDTMRTLVMFNSNFAPLAGTLCTGYFLHTIAQPVLRQSKNPEKNNRDLFIGYFLVFLSYALVGVFGYIGFVGYDFRHDFVDDQGALITT